MKAEEFVKEMKETHKKANTVLNKSQKKVKKYIDKNKN